MDRSYTVDTAMVVSDVIDGEAIMLHRGSGTYFSTEGIGGLIWQWIGEGRSRQQMLDLLARRSSQPSAEMSQALDSFVADLLIHALIREAEDGGDPELGTPSEPPTNGGAEFAAPVLHVYTDMRDLLLLDPIHEVEETGGWPIAKRAGDKP